MKIIKSEKSSWSFYVICICGILMFSSLVFAAYAKISEQIAGSKESAVSSSRKIVLDPGHGGEDGGAVGDGGIVEKDVNLSIALKLRDYLEATGYEVVMTRDKDTAIYDDDAETLREKKRSDLHNRRDIIAENEGENTIFVSVHQNKFPDSKYYGTQIFYSKNDVKSLDLANSVRESVVGLLQPGNTRETKEANKKIYLLNNAQIPAIVVECGFISNPDESKKLADKNYQSEVAFSIYCGIINYFNNNV